jgi:hypothetical protein
MSDIQSTNIPRETVLVEIALVPLAEEEDDFQTITTLEEVRDDVFSAASILSGYSTVIGSSRTRDAGLLLLLGEIAHQAIINKDLLIELFKAGTAAIGLLAKQGHIKRIEVTLAGDSMIIDEPDKVTVQRLLDTWEAKHPGKAIELTSSSTLQITGAVSKA